MAPSTEALIAAVSATLPLPSPLTSYSSPLPQIPSPPFHVPSPPTTSPTYTKASLGYKATGIRLRTSSSPLLPLSSPLPIPPPIILPRTRASMVMTRAAAPSTYCLAPPSRTPPSRTPPLLPVPLPTSSPPLLLPSTDCRDDIPEVMLLPRKRLCIAPGPRYEIRESSTAPYAKPIEEIGYRITDVWEDLDEIAKEIPATDVAELGQRMTNFVTIVREDTDEIYRTADTEGSTIESARSARDPSTSCLYRGCFENQVKFLHCTFMVISKTWRNSHVARQLVRKPHTNESSRHAVEQTYEKDSGVSDGFLKRPEINEKIRRGLLAYMITLGNVMTTKPKTMQDAIDLQLMPDG
ncbi:hypothetical protein Tco_0018218 [Tanacetum coccineum]